MNDKSESKLEASIGFSRKWDAREAGREVAESAIKRLSKPPSFFLLFSTIHYKDHGGFQELLDGVWDVLPEGTPLIGGTIAGFVNNYGCYTRGATALAVSYPDMAGPGCGGRRGGHHEPAGHSAIRLGGPVCRVGAVAQVRN